MIDSKNRDRVLEQRRSQNLKDLFSVSAGDVGGGVDLDLTLRFSDHVTLQQKGLMILTSAELCPQHQ